MGNIGDIITPSIPVVGSAGPQFAVDINAILTEIVARLSAKVPLSSISFSSDINLAGGSLLNALNVTFANAAGAPSGAPFSRFAVFGGNLYWVNAAGAVQITSGATINAAALAGITGDYGGVNPAEFRYITVDTRYNAYANFGTGTWAFVRALGFDIAGGATSTAKARLLWGGGADISLTLPATLPAANNIVSLDNAGAITAGTSTALPANGNITLSGTGVYKHGVKSLNKAILVYDCVLTVGTLVAGAGSLPPSLPGVAMSDNSTLYIRLAELPLHCRVVNVTVGFVNNSDRTNITLTLAHTGSGDTPSGVFTDIAATTLVNTGTSLKKVSGVNLTPTSGQVYYVKAVSGAAGVTGRIINMNVEYDIP